jgi:non-heme chloroperoxidase
MSRKEGAWIGRHLAFGQLRRKSARLQLMPAVRAIRTHGLLACVVMACGVLLRLEARPLQAVATPPWQDPSPHALRWVTVDGTVRLEVLEWGGTGRPIVLLAGAGNTAHVFDDFAPRLTTAGHVYGITRRGFGASSTTSTGYTTARLGEDVREALDALELDKAVLIGHSLAGQELSYLANVDRTRLGGVVYLDAAYRYALHRPGILDNVRDLRERLGQLETELQAPPRPPGELVATIERVMGTALEEVQQDVGDLRTPPPMPGRPPSAAAADLASVSAYQAWSRRIFGWTLPEAELRISRDIGADGAVGHDRPPSEAFRALTSAGAMRFTAIPGPVLAVFSSPHGLGPWAQGQGIDRDQVEAFFRFDANMTERQARWVERQVPGARVIRLPRASHYMFLSDGDDVSRECTAFIRALP